MPVISAPKSAWEKQNTEPAAVSAAEADVLSRAAQRTAAGRRRAEGWKNMKTTSECLDSEVVFVEMGGLFRKGGFQ